MNDLPDLRSFPMKGGVDYGTHLIDEDDRRHQEKIDHARDSADYDDAGCDSDDCYVDEGEGIESCEENRGPNYEPDPDMDEME